MLHARGEHRAFPNPYSPYHIDEFAHSIELTGNPLAPASNAKTKVCGCLPPVSIKTFVRNKGIYNLNAFRYQDRAKPIGDKLMIVDNRGG